MTEDATELVQLLFALVFLIISGYFIWFKPEKEVQFLEFLITVFYGNSEGLKDWIRSDTHLWVGRIGVIFMIIGVLVGIFLTLTRR